MSLALGPAECLCPRAARGPPGGLAVARNAGPGAGIRDFNMDDARTHSCPGSARAWCQVRHGARKPGAHRACAPGRSRAWIRA